MGPHSGRSLFASFPLVVLLGGILMVALVLVTMPRAPGSASAWGVGHNQHPGLRGLGRRLT